MKVDIDSVAKNYNFSIIDSSNYRVKFLIQKGLLYLLSNGIIDMVDDVMEIKLVNDKSEKEVVLKYYDYTSVDELVSFFKKNGYKEIYQWEEWEKD